MNAQLSLYSKTFSKYIQGTIFLNIIFFKEITEYYTKRIQFKQLDIVFNYTVYNGIIYYTI